MEARLLPFVRALERLERGAVLPPRVTGLYKPSRVVEVLPDTLRAGARSCGFPDVGIRPPVPSLDGSLAGRDQLVLNVPAVDQLHPLSEQ